MPNSSAITLRRWSTCQAQVRSDSNEQTKCAAALTLAGVLFLLGPLFRGRYRVMSVNNQRLSVIAWIDYGEEQPNDANFLGGIFTAVNPVTRYPGL